ncbi:MAG: LacI family transcriptional regulator [Spirochaetaceae bacterium]|nr:MAG: LacI family transcriptional regulator [Spirochaetaceae bacterium]
MAVTIKDVAREAGVSTATVSRVINNDARITVETRLRVLEAIAKLNYTVNSIARSLKSNRTHTVGFLTPEIANDFFMTVAQGVEDELRAAGYNMIICNTNESVEQETERLNLLIQKNIDGVIIVPAGGSGKHFRLLAELKLPTVLVDRLTPDFVSDAVLSDNSNGVYLAVHHLIKRGFTHFGFIGGRMDLTPAKERYDGFCAALREFSLEPDERYIRFGDMHVDSGYRAMSELMELPDRPACIFIANYYMNVGATKYVVERKIDRDELFLASFDEMLLSSVLDIPSLTIEQPIVTIGREAAKLLLHRIPAARAPDSEELPFPTIKRLPTRLVFHEKQYLPTR